MIPFIDFGGTGGTLHFLHANGYPPACYEPFMERLAAKYHILGMLLRALWTGSNPQDVQDWNPFSDDLLRFLDEHEFTAIIGVGHSIGATVTLRAALKEPERFQALVLIDPVLFPRYYMLEWVLARAFKLGKRIHPKIESALKRRREFDDLNKVFAGYRRREVFRFFSDQDLHTFINGMTKPRPGGGYELVFSPEWEARIYYTGIWHDWDLWSGLSKLNIPTLIVRGAHTDTFWESTARAVQKKNPKIKITTLANSTHLLPLEKPQEVFEIIQQFLEGVV
jgi:pimeloyl-ACP methyl ester carboxylesterase